jgi:selenocysteine lyase/cysteine desulfurase
VDTRDFEGLIRPGTRAIVCTHASNLTGNLVDIDRIGAIARAHGLLFILDASQTAGAMPIDMAASGISLLCFTGHKSMMGPQGTGGLCINGDIDVEPLKVGGTGVQSYLEAQPREYPTRLEAGTLNGHGIAGLSAAVDFINETGIDAIHAHESALARRFYEGVVHIPGVRVYGDFSGRDRCPIVALNVGDVDSALVCDALARDYGIATRAGAHCAPLMHRALGTEAQGAVRFSFGFFNTMEQADAAIAAVREIAGR